MVYLEDNLEKIYDRLKNYIDENKKILICNVNKMEPIKFDNTKLFKDLEQIKNKKEYYDNDLEESILGKYYLNEDLNFYVFYSEDENMKNKRNLLSLDINELFKVLLGDYSIMNYSNYIFPNTEKEIIEIIEKLKNRLDLESYLKFYNKLIEMEENILLRKKMTKINERKEMKVFFDKQINLIYTDIKNPSLLEYSDIQNDFLSSNKNTYIKSRIFLENSKKLYEITKMISYYKERLEEWYKVYLFLKLEKDILISLFKKLSFISKTYTVLTSEEVLKILELDIDLVQTIVEENIEDTSNIRKLHEEIINSFTLKTKRIEDEFEEEENEILAEIIENMIKVGKKDEELKEILKGIVGDSFLDNEDSDLSLDLKKILDGIDKGTLKKEKIKKIFKKQGNTLKKYHDELNIKKFDKVKEDFIIQLNLKAEILNLNVKKNVCNFFLNCNIVENIEKDIESFVKENQKDIKNFVKKLTKSQNIKEELKKLNKEYFKFFLKKSSELYVNKNFKLKKQLEGEVQKFYYFKVEDIQKFYYYIFLSLFNTIDKKELEKRNILNNNISKYKFGERKIEKEMFIKILNSGIKLPDKIELFYNIYRKFSELSIQYPKLFNLKEESLEVKSSLKGYLEKVDIIEELNK